MIARVILLVSLVSCSHASAAASTPMGKVVELLKDLSAKLAAEGQKEAAEYDKYACFCKEQKSNKEYAIGKSDDKIGYLKAEIDELSTAKSKLEGDISDLTMDISNVQKQLDKLKAKRDKDHDEYLNQANDVSEAIDSCKTAIMALKNPKKEMRGARLDLVQVTGGLVKVVKKQSLLNKAPGAVALLSKLVDPNGYEFQGNDLIATIEDLEAQFHGVKKDVDSDEIDSNAMYQKQKLGLERKKGWSNQELVEVQSIVEAKTDELHEAKGFKEQEEGEMQADSNFLGQLEDECKEKALLFDDRSRARAAEMTTIENATSILTKDAMDNYEMSKKVGMMPPFGGVQLKMSELQVGKVAQTLQQGPVSFVQIRNVQQRGLQSEEAIKRAQSFLGDAADRTGSSALSAIAVRVAVSRTGVDHYVKVRGLIHDLIKKLAADAASEADQKSKCDAGIKESTGNRDSLNAKIEDATGHISVLKSKLSNLAADTQKQHEQIAELTKAQGETTELYEEEVEQLEKLKETSEEGAKAVSKALEVLKAFYSADSLLQTGRFRPGFGNAGRDGQRTKDLAPEVFDDKYEVASGASEGIMGILEVILADLQGSASQAESDKKESTTVFEEFKKTTAADIETKNEKITANGLLLTEFDSDLLEQEGNLKEASSLLDKTMSKLDDWQALCVEGEETYEERKQKRQEEIAALKQAMEILEEWQN